MEEVAEATGETDFEFDRVLDKVSTAETVLPPVSDPSDTVTLTESVSDALLDVETCDVRVCEEEIDDVHESVVELDFVTDVS